VEQVIDLLDIDAAVLHRLDAVGYLQQLAGGLLGVGVGSRGGEFHLLSRSARANALACFQYLFTGHPVLAQLTAEDVIPIEEHAGPAVAEADLKAAALTSGHVLDAEDLIGHLRGSCGRHLWNAASQLPLWFKLARTPRRRHVSGAQLPARERPATWQGVLVDRGYEPTIAHGAHAIDPWQSG
jgi:hypothetical protein